MRRYGSLSDDFYVNMNLNTEMDLPQGRETVLHYFEQVRRRYPTMRNFYARDRGEYVLEEEKEQGSYRWTTVEARRVCSGYVNPDSIDDALAQHELILDMVPYALSVTPLDCESLNFMLGFDYTYRGNHSELLMEAFGIAPAFESLAKTKGSSVIFHEPSIHLSLDDDCRTRFRLNVETRTNPYHVRTGDFPEEQISVYLTARRCGSLDTNESFAHALNSLATDCLRIVDECVVEQVLEPLREIIAIK